MNKGTSDESREQLRHRMRALRAQLSDQAQREASQAAAQRILSLNAYAKAKTVMAYVAVRGELSLEPVIGDILSSGRRLVLPRCEYTGVMTARRVERLSQLEPGAFGLLEPSISCAVVPPQEIDLILAPGVAFDRSGSRLGQGGGYYDRFLPETRAVRVGVCHDFALLERLDAKAHDEKMDMVLTPDELFASGDKMK